ncbi:MULTISPECIES: ribonuclease domain-containing protein [unclassified Arcicella]|uniref:ribonuclease domain-containing protein n=1 Tax=unclassified Arcicella TaxID=2644986 RepID=UPI002855A980|nr:MULTISPECIES: ribonuclease domain-containing protein [unclassified Arcicella]MDR6561727.1 guanyl-specific ribonuclease Sa [Arcicella sp. BE51]MDR6812507.1 guanyl-specific ribonuclease Sa [Arcicella sp. BE140]MDR6823721.1 guanyl-specific ribonuclease Sa [Arcicella sp. BE139]
MKNILCCILKLVFFYFITCSSVFSLAFEKANFNNTLTPFETSENSYYYELSIQNAQIPTASTKEIPQNAIKVLKSIRENGVTFDGYVGGRKFGNYEGLLPKKDKNGQQINYREWDIYPKVQGKNRGAERLVTGSDGKAYFTKNHYQSFVEIK